MKRRIVMTAMRYVVLHHTGFGEPHFDLMIEPTPGAMLMTWRAADWPPVAGDTLARLPDHRRDYLDYEGPVSNNRGDVKRVAAGSCETSISPTQVTIQFVDSDRMMLILSRSEGDRWIAVEVD